MSEEAASDELRRALRGVRGQFAGGVAIVVAWTDGEPHAATASSCVVASFDPPRVAVLFAVGSRSHDRLERGRRFSVSLLDGADHDLARRFARPGRPVGWEGLAGVDLIRRDPAPPVLAGAVAWLDCAVGQVVPMGDHGCFVGDVLTMDRRPGAEPLVYYRGRFHRLGRAVAPAPWLVLDEDDLVADW